MHLAESYRAVARVLLIINRVDGVCLIGSVFHNGEPLHVKSEREICILFDSYLTCLEHISLTRVQYLPRARTKSSPLLFSLDMVFTVRRCAHADNSARAQR